MTKKFDFSGYATRNDVRCSDGRTIKSGAFKHQDGAKVPMVWNHRDDSPSNVLGHAILENRPEGVYAYGSFNQTQAGRDAHTAVLHGDVEALSIYANKLVERAKDVLHGNIREVSLVLAGANPGALIDNLVIQHSDGDEVVIEDEAIIYSDNAGIEMAVEVDETEEVIEHADGEDDPTVQDILETFSEEQMNVLNFLVGQALIQSDDSDDEEEVTEDTGSDVEHADGDISHSDNTNELADQEGTVMSHNVFEGTDSKRDNTRTLSHAEQKEIFEQGRKLGSMKEAVEAFSLKHGIDDIDILFPDAKSVTDTPDLINIRTEWVNAVMGNVRHTPFTKIKSLTADLTLDEARAKGYVKGNMKREEFFKVSKRTTTPQTVYKKQKLERDDVLDITDFDVVAWLKAEMRLKLDEEIARAILFGDGRSNADEDKIKEEHIRPIATDEELYVTTVYVNLDDNDSSPEEIIDSLVLNRRHYRGSGNPTFFTSETYLAKMLLIKDGMGRRIYPGVSDLAAAIRVREIVAVDGMDDSSDLVGILVNLADYNVGTDKGGQISMFDDFDIDYNQLKYLIEGRMSGALVKPKAAIVVRKVAGSATLVTPTAPTFEDNVVTVPTVTGVTYKNKLTNTTLTTASPVTLAEGDPLTVIATPTSGYYFATSADDEWYYEGTA